MRILSCPKGHYYDAEKENSCPYCNGSASYDSRTVGLGDNWDGCEDDMTVGDTGIPDSPKPGSMGSDETLGGPGGRENGGLSGYGKKEDDVTIDGWNIRPDGEKTDDPKTESIFDWVAPETNAEQGLWPAQEKKRPVTGWLVCVGGVNLGKSYCLYSGKNFVGRASDMDVCIEGDMSVSRNRHAIIVFEPRARIFFAQPGDSHELCYVNNELVLNNVQLKDRDVIMIGKTSLMFVPFCDARFGWDQIKTDKNS